MILPVLSLSVTLPARAQQVPPQETPATDTIVVPAPDTLVRVVTAPRTAAAAAAARVGGGPSAQAPGAEAEPTLFDRWKLAAEVSFTDQSGGRDIRLFMGGIEFSHREKEAFELDGSIESRYGSSQGDVIARNHFGSLSFDLHPGEIWSPFLFMTAERDPFKRLDLRFNGGAGAKYSPLADQRNANEVSLSLALLYSHENLRPSADEPDPNDRSLARWSLRVRGGRDLGEAVNISHVTFYQPMVDQMADYLLRSETGAKVILTERLALSVSYALNRTGRPPEGVAPEDRLFKTGLIIDF